VSNRLLVVALASCIQVVAADRTSAVETVYVHVFPFTGEVQLLNWDNVPAPFVFYSITSNSSALHGDEGIWLSISDVYDAGGNGFVDPMNDWVELSQNPMNLGQDLAEGTIGSDAALPPLRGISLGRILDPGVHYSDLTVDIRRADQTPLNLYVEDAIAGDYNQDRKVDVTDYNYWRLFFGAQFYFPLADGNLNGVVDAADYTIWRDNLGKELPAAGGQAASASIGLATGAVPEPASVLLVIGIAGGMCLRRSRRRSRGSS
jgi:hypothetical protein